VCGSKGTSTTSSTFTPPANVQANYDYLANQAKSVAETPFQQYQGEMVAGLTPTQEAGIQNVNASAGLAQPFYGAGAGYVQQAANPFGQQSLNQYMSPYINDVVAQTMANLGETNAQQRQQLLGNEIMQGAFGGDRGGVAQAELARQQNLATGQTLANVLQGGYGQALSQFNADQGRALQAGSTLGQLGAGAQSAALQGAQAQLSAGAQQQAVQQAQDVANQQQFQAAQAYPFQTTQYLGNLLLGIGGQSGGTALTAQPQGNVGTSLLGGLLTAGQMFRPFKDGGSVDEDNSMGGAVHEGLGRAAYALDGGVDYIPYAEQPSGGSSKPLSLADVMQVPTKVLRPVGGGRTNIPEAPAPAKEGETMMDIAKQLANATPEAKANLKANVAAIRSNLGLGTVTPADVMGTPGLRVGDVGGLYSSPIGPMQEFASGGVVGRHAYANDGAVKSDQSEEPQKRTLAEALVGHPLSEEANMGLLAAGLGMLSNKSPIFGIGVGEGATAGLSTYYNALANKRAYEKQQRELELTEEQRQIERSKLPFEQTHAAASLLTAQSGAKDVALKTLDKIKGSFSLGTGDPMFPQGHVNGPFGKHMSYDEYRKQMSGMLSASGALSPELVNILSDPSQLGTSTSPAANMALGGTASDKAQSDDQSDANINNNISALDQSANTAQSVQMAQAAPTPAPNVQTNKPTVDYDQLAKDALNRYNIAIQHPEFPNSAKLAEDAQRDFEKYSAMSPTIQGQARDIEAQKKALELGLTQMSEVDKGLGERSDSRPAARARINDASKLLSLWQSGRLNDIKAAAPSIAAALGLNIDKYALDNVASYETFTKDATQAMFDKVKDLGGRILVTEIEGQKQANMNPDLQPKTNRNIIGTAKGLMDAEDKFFDEYNTWRAGEGKYANTAQYNAWKSAWRKNPENDLEKFIDQGRANTPVRGDMPTNEKELKKNYKYVIKPKDLSDEQRAKYPNGLIARWTGTGWDSSSLEAPEY